MNDVCLRWILHGKGGENVGNKYQSLQDKITQVVKIKLNTQKEDWEKWRKVVIANAKNGHKELPRQL